jgi:hypothetical protein
MISDELDRWLPDPAIRTRHARTAPVDADRLWDAAGDVRLDETVTIGRLVQWRLPGTEPHQTFRSLLATDPFAVLDEGERYSLSGMVGRIWTLSRDYPQLDDTETFREWRRPGTVRVLFAHWAQDDGENGARIVSEARVQLVDRRAQLALRTLWVAMRVFERRVGFEVLDLVVRRANASDQAAPVS